MNSESTDITRHLRDWRAGDESAFEAMLPAVYDELRRIAKRYRARERGDHTLETTEIINEAYLKLINRQSDDWQSRTHFFAVAARVMRNLLVDHARTKNYQKRGAGAERMSLDDIAVYAPEPDTRIVELDEALRSLAEMDPRKAMLVELRYFGGLSATEAAEVIGVSEITVKREWLKAKAWLYEQLSRRDSE